MIKNVQALRAVAALMVVFEHLGDLLGILHLPVFGLGGVDLFFVISGFVMVHTTRVDPPAPDQFIRNRIARIVPIYWLLTLAVFAIAVFAPSWVKETTANGGQLVKSLLFIPFQRSNGTVQPVLYVGWTLNYEMFFYALFACGLACRRYLAGLAGVVALLLILVLAGGIWHPRDPILAFYTNARMLEFAFGMTIGLWIDRAPVRVDRSVKWLVLPTVLCLPGIIVLPLVWPEVLPLFTAGIPSVLLVTGVVLLERWGWSIKASPLLAIGDASYVLYLSHPYVTVPIQKLGLRFLSPNGFVAVALICMTLAAVTLAALVLHRTVERPLSKSARGLLSTIRLKPRPA